MPEASRSLVGFSGCRTGASSTWARWGATTARRRQSPKRLAACCGSPDTAMTPPRRFERCSGRCVWGSAVAVLRCWRPAPVSATIAAVSPTRTHTLEGGAMTASSLCTKELRRVVIAAAVGNVIEWYEFYIFGSLAAILSVQFFSKTDPVAAFLSTVAIFSVGFLIRPLGAFVFGRVGDLVGRKYTFLITLSGMGISTALIGVVPSYASIGVAAAFILFFLRLIQGLCLGGEYGGAITYVAEHVPDEKRGYYTGWLQTSPTLGIVVSLAVIIGTRTYLGNDAFNAWGWRIPFLLSLLMVAIAIYIRLRLQETPIFQSIKAKGQTATNPWREAFLSQNFKFVVIASIVVLGEGVVWYSGQFWALYFLQQIRKPDTLSPAIMTGIALLIASPTLILFGWLSDRIGRKPIILAGFALAALTYYPL